MKLKPITSSIVIRCRNKQELEALEKHTGFGIDGDHVDYIWNYGDDGVLRDCVEFNSEGRFAGFCTYQWFKERGDRIIDFTDLIDLTPEETLSALADMCKSSYCKNCYLSNVCNHNNVLLNVTPKSQEAIFRACQRWVADMELKQLNAETVDVCRIIEIKPDGKKLCVHEEDISDGDLLFSSDANEKCRSLLVEYCKAHKGEFIAIHEVVTRIKSTHT